VRGERNKRLQKLRSELTERSFAHLYETGEMRRVHLRGRDNILKRLLVHGAAFNLSLILRKRREWVSPGGYRGFVCRSLRYLPACLCGSGRDCHFGVTDRITLRCKAAHPTALAADISTDFQ